MYDFEVYMDAYPNAYRAIQTALTEAPVIETGEWHARDVSGSPAHRTHELQDAHIVMGVPGYHIERWQAITEANIPWAEDHFQERISGRPMNPTPSHKNWPYGNTDTHIIGGKFSHTYPERMWPRWAGGGNRPYSEEPNVGIYYELGDLEDLIDILVARPLTRQAFLPIWFPEDLTAAKLKQRVPCSLGYHFLIREDEMSVRYYMRSCEYTRHLRDDMYMAGRLLQYVCSQVVLRRRSSQIIPTNVIAYISSLHMLVGDE